MAADTLAHAGRERAHATRQLLVAASIGLSVQHTSNETFLLEQFIFTLVVLTCVFKVLRIYIYTISPAPFCM